MPRKRKEEADSQEAGLLETGLQVAKEVVGSSVRAIGRGVEQAARLNRAVLDVEANLIEPVSPTAAKLLRPEHGQKTARPPAGRAIEVTTGEVSGQIKHEVGKQAMKARKAAKKIVEVAKKRNPQTAKKASKGRK
jgi:hypothetical protein